MNDEKFSDSSLHDARLDGLMIGDGPSVNGMDIPISPCPITFGIERFSSFLTPNEFSDWELIPSRAENSFPGLQDPFEADLDLQDPIALIRARDVFITLDTHSPFYDAHRATFSQSVCSRERCMYDRLVKLYLIGDCDVGKTAMLHRLTTKEYLEEGSSPLDLTVMERIYWSPVYRIADLRPQQLKIHLFDAAGFHSNPLTACFLRGCHGVFLCFSVSDRESFENVESHWLTLIHEHAVENVAIILVGLKCDVNVSEDETTAEGSRRQVSTYEAQVFARRIRVPYLECSAKNGTHVDDCLATLLHHVAIRQVDANNRRLQDIKARDYSLSCSIM